MKLTRRETTFIDAIEQVEEPPAVKRQRILQFAKPSMTSYPELMVRAEVLRVLARPYVPTPRQMLWAYLDKQIEAKRRSNPG